MERTNVTDAGYTYNGQNYTNQTKVDSQGNSYNVSVPSTISTASLGTAPAPLPVVQPTYNTGAQQSQASQMGAYISSSEQQATADEQALRDAKNKEYTDMSQLAMSLGGRSEDQFNANNQLDANGNSVNSLAGKLRSINAQSQALGLDTLAKQQAEINKATGQNITQSAVQRNTADATRENLINTARLAMESAIVKADYDTAKSYADQIVSAKYDKITAELEAKKLNIENIRDNLTTAEKKVADATLARLKKEEQALAEKKANEQAVSKLIIEASPVAPTDVLTRAKDIQAKGGSATEVAMALGQYGGDYLANEKLKLEMKKVKQAMDTESLQQQKLRGEINAQNVTTAQAQTPEVSAWVANINSGKANLSDVPAKLKSAVSLGLSSGTTANPAKLQGYTDTLNLIKGIEDSGALTSVVGPSAFGRIGYTYNRATGEAQDFTAKVEQLTKGLTLQALIDSKAKGATFGALSEGELKLLADSATRINNYRKEDDNGNVYYDVNESGFKSALKEIQNYTQTAFEREGGSNFVTTGNAVADQFIKNSMGALNNANASTPAISAGYVDNQVKP